MEQNHQDERRRYERVDFTTRIVLKATGFELEARGHTRDLSLKGLYITTDRRLPLDTECSVEVFLSGGMETIRLSMKARIARIDKAGLGVSFDSMDLESYTHLKNLVMYNKDKGDAAR